ncbi:FkbM family methyltransferase [Candidatus Peregrinibacteria bacterium]|nr:FkbM family methyltransferase [Candidatus Peregrinibacteria bacterium]
MSYREKIIYNKKPVEITINSEAEESVFNEIFQEREYKILESVIAKAKSPIIDIGAHVGMFSVYCAVLNPKMQIFAYEPDEANFAAMKENLKLNGVKNVTMKNVAVGAEIGQRILYVSKDSHNHSLLGAEAAGDFSGEEKMVNVVTLERILEQNRLASVGLVKMDCEGAEFEILENLSDEVFDVVENFYVECHRYTYEMNPSKLQEIFKKYGFKVDIWSNHYDKRMGFIWARR